MPGTADSSQLTMGHTRGLQPHWWQLRESVFKKHKTPERRREPTGVTAEGTPKSEKEEQRCGKADFPHGGKV